jgi:hypothetical protein
MATTAAYNGSVTWVGANSNIVQNAYAWTLTYEAGEGETTDFTTTSPKTWIPLTTEWSGTVTCRLDASTAISAVGLAATEIELRITGTAFGYKGDAFATSAAVTLDVNGVPDLVVGFRGTAALTLGAI